MQKTLFPKFKYPILLLYRQHPILSNPVMYVSFPEKYQKSNNISRIPAKWGRCHDTYYLQGDLTLSLAWDRIISSHNVRASSTWCTNALSSFKNHMVRYKNSSWSYQEQKQWGNMYGNKYLTTKYRCYAKLK